jgi:nicotinate-nucleotide pyrophosphorylase (carboxylating)
MEGSGGDSRITRAIEFALLEDSSLGDPTSEAIVPEGERGSASVLCKEKGTIAGLEAAEIVFLTCDPHLKFEARIPDGALVSERMEAARVEGEIRSILRAERVALNLLQRMSGIATLTRRFVNEVEGTRAKITDTRKTAPGLRVFDKWAVRLGGGVNHRFGLDDMILIKDNHIAAAGGVAKALDACREYLGLKGLRLPVEIETKSMAEVEEAMRCGGFDRIMLDNFTAEEMRKAVEFIGGRVETEASGGMTIGNVRRYAESGVDFISVGALTHSPPSIDLSLELSPLPARLD